MNRREFLTAGLMAAVGGVVSWPRGARAIGDRSAFDIAQLQYEGGLWNPREGGVEKLLLEVEKRTSILVATRSVPVLPGARELFEHPFLMWSGDRGFDPLSEEAVVQLGLYLRAGGFLVIDNAEGVSDGAFDQSVRRDMARILPSLAWEDVPSDHVIYKSFYLLDQPYGRLEVSPVLEGIPQDDRLMVVYTHNDVQGAWARDNFGNHLYDVFPGGERQRELSYRFGINCVMYALCINYKADQVHVPFILKRRQWKVED